MSAGRGKDRVRFHPPITTWRIAVVVTLLLAACGDRSCATQSVSTHLDPRGGGALLRLDQSLELGVHSLVASLPPASPDATTLRAIAAASQGDLEVQLLELLGLPSDDAWDVATERSHTMGIDRWRAGVERLVRLLAEHGVILEPVHVAVLMLEPGSTEPSPASSP